MKYKKIKALLKYLNQNPVINNQNKTKAFILMDFLLGIVILSVLVISLSKAFFTLQSHALAQSQKTLTNLEINNALDIISNYLKEEKSFTFVDSTLSFSSHIVAFNQNHLWIDGALLCGNISSFEVKFGLDNSFSIHICYLHNQSNICLNRVGWLNAL